MMGNVLSKDEMPSLFVQQVNAPRSAQLIFRLVECKMH